MISNSVFLLIPEGDSLKFDKTINFVNEILGEIESSMELDYTNKCSEALEMLRSKSYKLAIISVSSHQKCYAYDIYSYYSNKILKNTKNRRTTFILLEEDFNGKNSKKGVIFDSLTATISLRKKHLEGKSKSDKILLKNSIKFVTMTPDVYISYGNTSESDIIQDKIRSNINKIFPNVNIIVDKDALKYKQSVSDFMNSLALGSYVILLINEKFLRSDFCMQEFINIHNSSKEKDELIKNRIFPITFPCAEKYFLSASLLENLKSDWEAVKSERNDNYKKQPFYDKWSKTGMAKIHKEVLDKTSEVINHLPILYESVEDLRNTPLEEHKNNNFLELICAINQQFREDGFVSFFSSNDDIKNIIIPEKTKTMPL